MPFDPSFGSHPVTLRIEHCDIRIMDGNWGVFHQSFSGHVHGYHELHLVTGGSGRLSLRGAEIPLTPGCMYLLAPRTWHEQWSNPEDPLQEYHLGFDVVCGDPTDTIWQRLFRNSLILEDCPTIQAHFDRLAAETRFTGYGHADMLRLLAQALFIDLARVAGTSSDAARQPDTVPDEQRILRIDHAILYRSDTITLADLSAELSLSERQIQRAIAARYGTTFQGLKARSRLSHAAMLLSTTPLSIGRIAQTVGYANESAFSRAFRALYGLTPSQWRRERPAPETS